MRSIRAIGAVVLVGLAAGIAHSDQATKPEHGTITRDVVEVADNKQIAGVETFAVDFRGYRYLFATELNAAKFTEDPDRYSVGFDGKCASMGPLSGRGSTEYMVEHDGRLYLCASASCLAGFSADPEGHIDRDDPAPSVRKDKMAEGMTLIDRAIATHLGEAGLGRVDVVEERFEEDVTQGVETYHHVERLIIRADGSVCRENTWNDSSYADVATPADAWSVSSDSGASDLYEAGRRELERRVRNTHWLSVLRASKQPDAVVMSLGWAKLLGGSQEIQRVLVAYDGTTCVVGLEPNSGRVKSIEYTGRGPDNRFGTRSRVFTAYTTVDGVVAPTAWDTWSGGGRQATRSGVQTIIDPEGVGALFDRPAD